MAISRHACSILSRLQASAGCVRTLSQQSNLTALCHSAAFSAVAAPPLLAACILERLPIVAPPVPAWEQEYQTWCDAAFAGLSLCESTRSSSLAPTYPLRTVNHIDASLPRAARRALQRKLRRFKPYPPEFAGVKKDSDADAELEDYESYAGEIEAAENADHRSPWRRLNQRIFMLCKVKGQESQWSFPSASHVEGETIRSTAERALAAALEPGPKIFFLGNSPAGHVALPGGAGTLFFHRAQLVRGAAEPVKLQRSSGGEGGGAARYSDFVLVAKDELGEYIKDEALVKLLQAML